MKIKPILFNTEMIRAILADRKTVTRRPVRPHYRDDEVGFQIITDLHTGAYVRIEYYDEWENETRIMTAPYCPGDILYVREAWAHPSKTEISNGANPRMYLYKADVLQSAAWDKWRPSIHMPREAARLFLRVTDVRVERLQDITYWDCLREGITEEDIVERGANAPDASAKWLYAQTWNKTIKPADRALYGWEVNPWVWVIEFERISKEDAYAHNDF